jgi:serine/threonine protein phosphatase 1
MVLKLFRSRAAAADPTPPSTGSGRRIYAIGDIHGRDDLLDDLLARMVADDAARPAAETIFIFLGDLVDRGPGSAQVIDRLMRFRDEHPNSRFLLGNHEEVFLLALSGNRDALRMFNRIGGRETILSYGVDERTYENADYAELHTIFAERVPAAHIAFLESFDDMIIEGDYAFVHAGVRPEVPLEEQKPKDLRWIRDDFLDAKGRHEKIVVHGHTISPEVVVTENRIGIDTGAFASGILTAMGFEGAERWLIQTES